MSVKRTYQRGSPSRKFRRRLSTEDASSQQMAETQHRASQGLDATLQDSAGIFGFSEDS
eukprot:SAG31_NODE_31225_length_370_cov_1.512915_1_plen_58_part_10